MQYVRSYQHILRHIGARVAPKRILKPHYSDNLAPFPAMFVRRTLSLLRNEHVRNISRQ